MSAPASCGTSKTALDIGERERSVEAGLIVDFAVQINPATIDLLRAFCAVKLEGQRRKATRQWNMSSVSV